VRVTACAQVIIHRAILGSIERFTGMRVCVMLRVMFVMHRSHAVNIAVLMEHTAGRWPLWLSPRQVRVKTESLSMTLVVLGHGGASRRATQGTQTIARVCDDDRTQAYAEQVTARLQQEGYFVDTSLSDKTMNKRIMEASVMHVRHTCDVVRVNARMRSTTTFSSSDLRRPTVGR
jgi:threonyl-tRNA synthetase